MNKTADASLLIFAALQDWNGTWEREQQLATQLAKRYDVVFIEAPASLLALVRQPKVWIRRVRAWRQGVRRVGDRIRVWTPPPSPFPLDKIPFIGRAYIHMVATRIQAGMTEAEKTGVVLLLTHPETIALADRLHPSKILLDWNTPWLKARFARGAAPGLSAIWNAIERWYSRWVDEALRRADAVITIAHRYRQAAEARNVEAVTVTNGADISHFSRACDPELKLPADLEVIPHPRLGVIASSLRPQVIDQPLIHSISSRHPEWHIVFIGGRPGEEAILPSLSNVHNLGRRSYGDLPAYLKGFDVCLIPYRLNAFTQSGIPTKLPEYLAAGKPVVSTYLPEIQMDPWYAGVTDLAKDPEEFISMLEARLDHPDEQRVRRGIEIANRHSWEHQSQVVVDLIERDVDALGAIQGLRG